MRAAYDYIYLNERKIDAIYAGLVDRAEDQVKITTSGKQTAHGQAKLSFGALLQMFGVSPELSGDLGAERAAAREVTEKLLPVQKLRIVRAALEQQHETIDLTDPEKASSASLAYVRGYVSVRAGFKMEGSEHLDLQAAMDKLNTVVILVGRTERFSVRVLTSGDSLLSPTIFPRFVLLSRAPDGIPLDLFGQAVGADSNANVLDVDPIAMHYSGRAPF